mmetsp:Transcript_142112/g.454270  ORF Transcript_142112/g.454270 Transcript_142112/m.454270 type:complete len:115 (-) Transcript_142112:12-356(-)
MQTMQAPEHPFDAPFSIMQTMQARSPRHRLQRKPQYPRCRGDEGQRQPQASQAHPRVLAPLPFIENSLLRRLPGSALGASGQPRRVRSADRGAVAEPPVRGAKWGSSKKGLSEI